RAHRVAHRDAARNGDHAADGPPLAETQRLPARFQGRDHPPVVRERRDDMKHARTALLPVVLLVAAGCGHKAETNDVQQANDAPIAVRTAAATSHPTPDTLDVNGTLAADQQSDLTSIVPGRVTEVFVERGAKVNEGDPIVKLRDVDFRLQA